MMHLAHFAAVAVVFGVLVCRARHISAQSLWTTRLQHGQLVAAILSTLIVPAAAAVVILCLSVALYFGLSSLGPWAQARQASRQPAANVIPFSSNAGQTSARASR